MEAEITLKIDKYLIDTANEYAQSHKKSLSSIIEAYLSRLVSSDKSQLNNDIEISPFVKSLRTGVKIPADYDYEESYNNHLAEKYK
jgi:hypothetical protein